MTSTGFLTPGLSALIIRELGIDPHCSRVDVVGMGCNAGLNALNGVAGWSAAHPGELAVHGLRRGLLGRLRLRRDDAHRGGQQPVRRRRRRPGAASGRRGRRGRRRRPAAASSSSPAASSPTRIDAMRYDWDDDQSRFSFFLDPAGPVRGRRERRDVVDRLLAGTGLRRSDIAHWLVHSGGKKVIDAVGSTSGLTRHDVRHTTGVLRDYGNLSSGSFLFSYERLLGRASPRPATTES